MWERNFLGTNNQAILVYDPRLASLPAYLQQLEMESNGKSRDRYGEPLEEATAPIVWGGVGLSAQHSFLQALHQGTLKTSVDFIVAGDGGGSERENRVLWPTPELKPIFSGEGIRRRSQGRNRRKFGAFSNFKRNQPSNFIFYPRLTPEILGALLALYEHKIYVESIIWGTNAFDQWGVERGKRLAKEHLEAPSVGMDAALLPEVGR